MHRIGKLLGIIFIFGIVFFIICDEKGYKIGFNENRIVFDKTEKESDLITDNVVEQVQFDPNAVYKNSDIIRINPEFQNPINLRKGDGVDRKYLAKIKKENKNKEKTYTGPNVLPIDNGNSISSVFQGVEVQDNTGFARKETEQKTGTIKEENKQNTGMVKQKLNQSTGGVSTTKTGTSSKVKVEKPVVYYPVEKYEYTNHILNLRKGVEIPKVKIEKYPSKENLAINLMKGIESEPEILYKNSNRIQIYSGFENPISMSNSSGMDEEFLAKQKANNPTIISLDEDTISSTWENNDNNVDENVDVLVNNFEDLSSEAITYKIEKLDYNTHSIKLKKSAKIQSSTSNDSTKENYVIADRSESSIYPTNIGNEKEVKPVLIRVEKYQLNRHPLNLRKGETIEHNFVVDNIENINQTNGISDSMFENLLENEEIDINTLESENDEFLQKVFEKTKDKDIMNLIVETYLNEYQFVKAKKFVENLPEIYLNELDPLLNLRVAFNSFSLSSRTINESLSSVVQGYASKNKISDEDKNRYLGVIALIDRNYDKFFEISAGFTSEKHQTFTLKIQGYKNQIAKQMGMPEYYFDTLVALELFNQGLFQPAKVLSLYSLQKNSNYILPYQVLAYANFLTNSRDTSIEYFKKLVDIDPNNAEKYRFLMGVAFYRDEKYEQSVVMLSMIKDENLRLDAQRYLINDYLKLNQKNRLISTRNKLLGYKNLVASDFYTYFYEAFFHPYAEGAEYQLYAYDTELANKMLRACSTILSEEERVVCTYGSIGRNIALGQFNGIEQYLLNLVAEYPQGYLYQALGEYYVQQGDLDKAKAYFLKAVSLTQERTEKNQIKKLLQDIM